MRSIRFLSPVHSSWSLAGTYSRFPPTGIFGWPPADWLAFFCSRYSASSSLLGGTAASLSRCLWKASKKLVPNLISVMDVKQGLSQARNLVANPKWPFLQMFSRVSVLAGLRETIKLSWCQNVWSEALTLLNFCYTALKFFFQFFHSEFHLSRWFDLHWPYTGGVRQPPCPLNDPVVIILPVMFVEFFLDRIKMFVN